MNIDQELDNEAWNIDYIIELAILGEVGVEEARTKLKALTLRHTAEVLERVYSKAQKFANTDKTMVGAESLRGYHYFNALTEVTEELAALRGEVGR